MEWILVGAIGLAVCGGAGAYVAAQKKREQGEGLVFGLILGPIGVLIVACLPSVEPGRRIRIETPAPVEPTQPQSRFCSMG